MTAPKPAARGQLRAVGANERSRSIRKPRERSVTQAAAAGDRLSMLIALRTRVATAVESPNAPLRELAALTKRLMEIQNDIDAVNAKSEEVRDDSSGADSAWEAI